LTVRLCSLTNYIFPKNAKYLTYALNRQEGPIRCSMDLAAPYHCFLWNTSVYVRKLRSFVVLLFVIKCLDITNGSGRLVNNGSTELSSYVFGIQYNNSHILMRNHRALSFIVAK
jgi:hypothetical protein